MVFFSLQENKMKSHLQAPKKLCVPVAPVPLLKRLYEGLLIAASVSCMPLWSTVSLSLPAPANTDSLGYFAWISLLVRPVQPRDTPPRVTDVHFSETNFANVI